MSENDTLNLNNLKFLELDTTLTLRATLMLMEQNGLVLGSQSKRRKLKRSQLGSLWTMHCPTRPWDINVNRSKALCPSVLTGPSPVAAQLTAVMKLSLLPRVWLDTSPSTRSARRDV